jgi:hypothetical protein
VIPRWFLYLQGFGMLIMGVSLIVMRPRKPDDGFYQRYVNIGTMWALVCCTVGVAMLAMALGYWQWPPAAPPPAPHLRHR